MTYIFYYREGIIDIYSSSIEPDFIFVTLHDRPNTMVRNRCVIDVFVLSLLFFSF